MTDGQTAKTATCAKSTGDKWDPLACCCCMFHNASTSDCAPRCISGLAWHRSTSLSFACQLRTYSWSPPTPLCKSRTFILSSLQHDNLQPTCDFVRRPSRLELTAWKYVEINIYSHLQTLSKDIVIRADYAFSALETIRFSFNGLYKCTI